MLSQSFPVFLPPAASDLVRHDLEDDDVVMILAAAGFGLAFLRRAGEAVTPPYCFGEFVAQPLIDLGLERSSSRPGSRISIRYISVKSSDLIVA